MATLLAGAALGGRWRGLRSWLLVLFKINAGHHGVSMDTLRGAPPIDLWLLLLTGVTLLGFWPGPGTDHVVWMCLAVGQPLVGIPLVLVTREAGRSGLMGGALVLSVLMLVDGVSVAAGWLGVVASVSLLVVDFGTTGRSRRLLAALLAVGYGALIAWFAWTGLILLS